MYKKRLGIILLLLVALTHTGFGESSFHFVFITDIHADGSNRVDLALERMAKRVKREKPEVIIGGGDLIAGGLHHGKKKTDREWRSVASMSKLFTVPFYSAMGNHDFSPATYRKRSIPIDRTFRRFFSQRHSTYVKKIKGYYFLFINSVVVSPKDRSYSGHISPDHMKAARRLLEKIPVTAPLVIISHIPLFSSHVSPVGILPKRHRVDNNHEFYRLIGHHNVILILQGHLHRREKVYHQGILHITGGAVCGAWWSGANHGTEEGFYSITITGKRITARYIDYQWDPAMIKKE